MFIEFILLLAVLTAVCILAQQSTGLDSFVTLSVLYSIFVPIIVFVQQYENYNNKKRASWNLEISVAQISEDISAEEISEPASAALSTAVEEIVPQQQVSNQSIDFILTLYFF